MYLCTVNNILSYNYNGMKNNGTFGLIDSLTISYDGNHLLKVTDDAEALNYNGALDFNDGDDSTCEYDYDDNGALTRDSNRGINSITYDYGHHPYYINMNMASGPRNIRNDYTPDGRKLSSRHVMSFPIGRGYTKKTITDLYVDGLMLRGDTTLLWQFGGGYVELNANGTPTSWNYYITDHLGSTRMVVDSNDSIRETISYYPFGSEIRMENPALLTGGASHPFRFTGKELIRQTSLNMYDFGARLYDVAGVPIWTSIDPLAEKYYNLSPYNYCGGNPVNLIDPDGRDYAINIDSDKMTITISATFYTNEESYSSALHAANLINGQNNMFSYIVDNSSYSVVFDINVVKTDGNDIGSLNYAKAIDDTGYANIFLVVTDDVLNENQNGVTTRGSDIRVKSSRRDSETGGHEMGHTLGMTHSDYGIMTAESSSPYRTNTFTESNIKDMIVYPLKGKTNYYYSQGQKLYTGHGFLLNNLSDNEKKRLLKGKVK